MNRRRTPVALRAVAIVCLALICLATPQISYAEQTTITVESATGSHVFDIEIADDPQERASGLMHRREMARNAGMLFVYDPPQEAAFWMKNTPLTLDILYADAAGVIINIARRTTPFSTRSIPSGGVVRGVLEINGGVAEELGVTEGDRLIHPVFAPGG